MLVVSRNDVLNIEEYIIKRIREKAEKGETLEEIIEELLNEVESQRQLRK